MVDGELHQLSSVHQRLTNEGAEAALLGALLVKPQLMEALPSWFNPGHYASRWNQDVHRAIQEVGRAGGPALLAVGQALAIDDPEFRRYITSLTSAAVSYSPGYVAQAAEMVTDLHRRRALIDMANQIRSSVLTEGDGGASSAVIARVMSELDGLTATNNDGRPYTSLDDAMDAALELADRAAKGEGTTGLSTGFPSIDDRIGGLEPGTMTVIAARPGMGKSVLGHQVAINAARAGVGVLEVSLEMSATQLGMRALSVASGVPLEAIKRGRHASSMSRLVQARRELHGLPLTIEDGGGLTAGMIQLKARSAKRRHGLGLIMIDHLHIVRPEESDVRQGATWAVGRISGAMKRLAKEMDCPVLVLAQLNRGVEGRDDKRPGLADLRHAGDIEQDADAVGFIYRAEYYLGGDPEQGPTETNEKHSNRVARHKADKERLRGKAELIFPKVRDGSPGTVPLNFHGDTVRFSEPMQHEFGDV